MSRYRDWLHTNNFNESPAEKKVLDRYPDVMVYPTLMGWTVQDQDVILASGCKTVESAFNRAAGNMRTAATK